MNKIPFSESAGKLMKFLLASTFFLLFLIFIKMFIEIIPYNSNVIIIFSALILVVNLADNLIIARLTKFITNQRFVRNSSSTPEFLTRIITFMIKSGFKLLYISLGITLLKDTLTLNFSGLSQKLIIEDQFIFILSILFFFSGVLVRALYDFYEFIKTSFQLQ